MLDLLEFDAVLLIYLAALFILAVVVRVLCPPFVLREGVRFNPVAGLFILGWILYPTFLSILAPIYINQVYFPFSQPDWLERLVQVLAPILTLYITFRGAVWGIKLVLIGFSCAGVWCIYCYVRFGFVAPPPFLKRLF